MNNPASRLLQDVVSHQQSKLRVCGIIIAVLAAALAVLSALLQNRSTLREEATK